MKLTDNQETMLGVLRDAGRSGLSNWGWNANARARGFNPKSCSTMADAKVALKRKNLVRVYAGRWYAGGRIRKHGAQAT